VVPLLDASRELTGMQVDGVLDEAAWASARVYTDFTQFQPVEGDPVEHDTEVRVLLGDGAVWVGARMWDTEPERIAARLTRRDSYGQYDSFIAMFDPDLDGLTGYYFRVSAANVQSDTYLYDDDQFDEAWDAVWSSGVAIDDRGWTVEMRIPLAQLRYEAAEAPQDWGVNFHRTRLASNEQSYYALVSRTQSGMVSQMARLEDVRVAESARRLEMLPYVVSSVHRGPATAGDPYFDGTAADGRVGVDLSYGLGAAFTLDATINPDFGQVEADPAVINLSAFETFFQERRPFFVEDARVFDFGLSAGGRLFYSRRVGRAPQGASRNRPSGSLFTDVPDNATILGAAKLAGRTQSGVSVGALVAVTGNEHGAARLPGNVDQDFLVEPRSEFGTVSVAQDFRGGASQIGLLGTAMRRDLPADGSFDWLPSSAFSGGVRFNHQWSNRTWAVFGYLSGAYVRGDSAAIRAIQVGSVHYYQRPDATRFRVDADDRWIAGRDWRVTFAKQNGTHWTGSIWAAEVTKGFDVNDLGFSTRNEVLDGGAEIRYREIRPGSLFRNYSINVRTFHNWSHEALDDTWSFDSWRNARTGGNYGMNANAQFLNYWNVNLGFQYGLDQMSRRQTRGGPMMQLPGSTNFNVNLSTDARKAVSVGMFANVSDSRRGIGSNRGIGAFVEMQPSDNLAISLSQNFFKGRSGDQYVTVTSAVPYAPTYGRRYLFADLEQTQLQLDTRVDWTFSPTLSLQLFAQTLIGSGDYLKYKQLAAAETYDFIDLTPTRVGDDLSVDFDNDGTADYTFNDRDFNVRSLIGNAVLRWEYRPGSTVFLVWQRAQSHSEELGDFDFGRDARDLFGAPADDRFILKVNYWLGL